MPLPMFQKRQPPAPLSSIAHVVAIAAGKGGVGKSSVTVNLALALKKAGYAVGIMDTDVYGPSIRRMLPEDQLPAQKGEMFVPAQCSGIKVMSMAYFRKENAAAAIRAPVANGVISQFIKNVNWGPLDFLLIDFPPGTGDIQLTLSQQANLSGAVMVTTPQEISLMDVRKAMDLFDQMQVPVFGIIENMSYYCHPATNELVYLFGKGGGERLSRESGAPFLGQIPLDPAVSRCCDEGQSLFSVPINSPAAEAFESIAKNLVANATALQRLSKESQTTFNLQWKEMT